MPGGVLSEQRRRGQGRRFPVPLVLVVAVVGLVLLFAGQGVPNRHSMEHDLTVRSQAALRAAGLSTVEVSFTGRDGTLHAGTDADARRALAIVRALDGVRVARVVVATPGPATSTPATSTPAPTGTPPVVTLTLAGGRLSIAGTVPSAAAATALVDAGTASFGAGTATSTATVDPGVSDAGLATLAPVVAALGRGVTAATVELRDGTLTLTGTVASTMVRDAVLAAATGTGGTGTPSIVDKLVVTGVPDQLVALPTVTFVTGSATLTAQGAQVVGQVADILRANPEVRISVEGHTDTTGTPAANQALSQARAGTVLTTLVSLGIAADRLTARGFGSSRPKVPDTTPANQAVNRRVEFVVQP